MTTVNLSSAAGLGAGADGPDAPTGAGLARAWWAQPVVWTELFAISNVAFLAVDIALAHAVNAFGKPAEWIPVAFSLAATVLLGLAMLVGGPIPSRGEPEASPRRGRAAARWLVIAIGGGSVLVGVAGLLYHLNGDFFQERTLRNLVYTAPFVAPLAYAGLGLLLILNRMVDSRTDEWARWVVLLAAGGFLGNFILSLADHAQNGFFRPTEWSGVIAGAFGFAFLVAAVVVPANRPMLMLCGVVMLLQTLVGVWGFALHLLANLNAPAASFWDRFVYGAPVFAPLLFADLAMLGAIGLWALAQAPTAETEAVS